MSEGSESDERYLDADGIGSPEQIEEVNKKRPRSPSISDTNENNEKSDKESGSANKRVNIEGQPSSVSSDLLSPPNPAGASAKNSVTLASTNPSSHSQNETSGSISSDNASAAKQQSLKPAPASAGLPAKVEAAKPVEPVAAQPQEQKILMKALVVTEHAGMVIGKQGVSVKEIKEKSNANVKVSRETMGNPQRILSVEGQLDAVAKAFGLIVRRVNKEPFDVPSVPGSRDYTLHLLVPNNRMGMIIGKGGSKIKEIQEASGARINPREEILPESGERVLDVSGVADALHIATYYIGVVLLTPQIRSGNTDRSHVQSRPQSSNINSVPQPRASYQQRPSHQLNNATSTVVGYQSQSIQSPQLTPQIHQGPISMTPQLAPAFHSAQPQQVPMQQPFQPRGPGVLSTAQQAILNDPYSRNQDIFVPAEFMGGLIGAKGAIINEIRNSTQTVIKIPEPGEPGAIQPPNPHDRLITITGLPNNISLAVQKIFERLEMEKKRAEAYRLRQANAISL